MKRLLLSDIRVDGGTQIRAAISEQVVSEYAERMSEGATFPPIVIFHDGNENYLADGFHRVMASQRVGFKEIDADIRAGTKEDALWFALGANRTNGYRLTLVDKKHAVLLALRSWPDKSAAIIAEQIGCSKQYVSGIRNASSSALHLPDRVTGVDGKSYAASPSAQQIARAKATTMIREGASVDEVKKATGLGRDAVNSIRRDEGAVIDKSRSGVSKRREQMREMAASGHTSRQIAAALGISEAGCRTTLRAEGIDVPADKVTRGTHRHKANRIMERIVMDAENLTEGVNLIEFDDLDRAQIPTWLGSLKQSRDKLSSFIRRLMQEQQNNVEVA